MGLLGSLGKLSREVVSARLPQPESAATHFFL